MTTIKVSPKNAKGKIKCINAVNNGPVAPGVRDDYSNFEYFKAAKIPYARNHDASFRFQYNGEHIVDVHRIFRDFDADENDPKSYIFEPTDKYTLNTLDAGAETFYRLGATIEHYYKFGTYPPKDYAKWARICEHIIMHYNEGWADGYKLGIEYWEIWNEADCVFPNGTNPCWQGTEEEFVDFYEIAAKHLKNRFPNIKIGGPATCEPWESDFKNKFLKRVKENNVPLDFYSFHCYSEGPDEIARAAEETKKLLKKHGISEDTELILNEWNYIKGWSGAEWKYSIESERGLRGASYIASVMAEGQRTGIDMLMYYDASPCTMNGLFEYGTYKPLKGYYSYLMARDIVELGTYIPTEKKDNIYSIASTDGRNTAIMLTYYREDDEGVTKDIKLELKDMGFEGRVTLSYYLLDEANDLVHIRDEYINSSDFDIYLKMSPLSSYLIKITQ